LTTLILGPMYCGKTSQLFRYMERDYYAKTKFCLIRPSIDTRDFVSHSSSVNENFKGLDVPTFRIKEVTTGFLLSLNEFDAIYIDEAFMIKNVWGVPFSFPRKDIYIASLLASSENRIFEEVAKLLPYCEHIEKLNSVCTKCGNKTANYTICTVDKENEIQVGGQESYIVLCSDCKNKPQNL